MTSPPRDGRIQSRLDDDTTEWLGSRCARMRATSLNLQARTELELWRAVLAAEMRRIRLTLGEASCLGHVLRDVVLDATVIGVAVVYGLAFDAFRTAREAPLPGQQTYADIWAVDEARLLDLLSRLGPAGDAALRDALSRWAHEGLPATVDGFAAIDLIVTDTSPA